MSSSTSSTHNILFTLPRTGSNLVMRILNLPNQSSISRHHEDGYFFLPTQRYRYTHSTVGRPVQEWTDDERSGMDAAHADSFTAWKSWVNEVEPLGKGTYIKEHINWTIRPLAESNFLYKSNHIIKDANLNLTSISDSFLGTVHATFLIRHPALVVPSLVRVAVQNEGMSEVLTETAEKTMQWESTYAWHVSLYRFLVNISSHPSHDPEITFPIILDASDLANKALVRRYAAAVGLDADAVRFEWDAVTSFEDMNMMKVAMKETLLTSEGLVMEKLARVEEMDIDVLKGEWREEFGEDLGSRVRKLVEGAMEDYEWLWERRLKM
jgi:hypothetical protein